jgi:tetratricopeptide (TPR) repeat protein
MAFAGTMALLVAAIVTLQVIRDRCFRQPPAGSKFLYVPSGTILGRLALSYDAVLADVYWIRALQFFGSSRLSKDPDKTYDLLYPLLDITTDLDPRFMVGYRFGALFLAEGYPDGAGRPDLAVKLLEKAMRHDPDRWQYPHDVGFIYYWWLHDYERAAKWFERGASLPDGPWWLRPLAAATLAQGGNRRASRTLWQTMYETAEHAWLREEASRRLMQLAALDELDRLGPLVQRYIRETRQVPSDWQPLVAAKLLPAVPVDPTGVPYVIDTARGILDVSSRSRLSPLPAEPPAAPPPPVS